MTIEERLKMQEDCIVSTFMLMMMLVGSLAHTNPSQTVLSAISDQCELLRQKVEALTASDGFRPYPNFGRFVDVSPPEK